MNDGYIINISHTIVNQTATIQKLSLYFFT